MTRDRTWLDSRLGDLVSLDRDGIVADMIEDGTKYVGLEHITNDGEFVGVAPVETGQLASNKFRFNPSQLLYGKLRPYLKKTARPDFDGICSTDILPLSPSDRIDRNYLFHFLRHPEVVAKAASLATGANLPRLSPKALMEFRIRHPADLADQRRIAAILDKADALRRKAKQALDLTDELIRSTFLDMFGDPVTNPKEWPTALLDDFCRPRQWKTIPGKELLKAGFPVFGANGLIGFYDEYNHEDPVVAITCRGATCGTINVTPPKCYVTGNAMCLDELDTSRIVPEFLEWALRVRGVHEAITGSAQPQITRESLRAVNVVIPSPAAQKPFTLFAIGIRGIQAALSNQVAQAEVSFNCCLQRAFTGGL